MSELEQYQNSIKEFNERTRLGFENFIQSNGSDRNKLQLRCTPFTDKKGGYGSFDLDFGLSVYQHQQSKVDELTKQRDSFIKAYEIEMDKSIELQKRLDAIKKIVKDAVDSGGNSSVEIVWDEILELEQALKGGCDASN